MFLIIKATRICLIMKHIFKTLWSWRLSPNFKLKTVTIVVILYIFTNVIEKLPASRVKLMIVLWFVYQCIFCPVPGASPQCHGQTRVLPTLHTATWLVWGHIPMLISWVILMRGLGIFLFLSTAVMLNREIRLQPFIWILIIWEFFS